MVRTGRIRHRVQDRTSRDAMARNAPSVINPAPAGALLKDLQARWGPVIGGEPLATALGFPSLGAFRRALSRGNVGVPVFQIEGRRGRFALTRDVAAWLARQAAGGR